MSDLRQARMSISRGLRPLQLDRIAPKFHFTSDFQLKKMFQILFSIFPCCLLIFCLTFLVDLRSEGHHSKLWGPYVCAQNCIPWIPPEYPLESTAWALNKVGQIRAEDPFLEKIKKVKNRKMHNR